MTVMEFSFEDYGRVLRELRLDKRLLQKELAARSGVCLTTLVSYEHNCPNPRMDYIIRLFRALGVDEIRIDTRREIDGEKGS